MFWNKKLSDQIFEMRYMCKMLNVQSQKCEKEQAVQKQKAKIALEKGSREGARIHAENSIRKKEEAVTYLTMASRLDAVISKLDQQNSMAQINSSMTGVAKNINRFLKFTSAEKVQKVGAEGGGGGAVVA